MFRVLEPLLLLIAKATDREMARVVEYLKEENRILRDKLPKRITVTLREKQRLLKFGKKLGNALKDLISIVSYRTFCRWLGTKGSKKRSRQAGRPKKPQEVRDLILQLARETGWGYTRILGELKKLGIHSVSRSTIVNLLKENGLDPGPKRGRGSWDEFLKRHAQSLWACDFFSQKIITWKGMVDIFAWFFIHIGTRKVFFAGCTTHPNETWVVQQARNFALHLEEQSLPAKYLILDLDTKFTEQFRSTICSEGIRVIRVGPRKPNCNAFAERWVQSIKQECLDHFLVFGEEHFRYLVISYTQHYNEERPHQSLGNVPLSEVSEPTILKFPTGKVKCKERLGGLLKHYYRDAA
jgi:putative transposase